MIIKTVQLFTNVNPTSKAGIIFQYPLVWIVIALLFLIPVFLYDKAVKEFLISPAPKEFQVHLIYAELLFSSFYSC